LQFPLQLGIARTVSSAQGSKFSMVFADYQDIAWLANGFYVAVSRAKSAAGLCVFRFKTAVENNAVMRSNPEAFVAYLSELMQLQWEGTTTA
jgi:hypothetical protein